MGEPGSCFWFLDEITAVDGPWPAVVKRVRDSNLHFAEDTVVLSGSSTAQLDDATKALAGRRGRAVKTGRLLLQMPFVEFVRAAGHPLPSPMGDQRCRPVGGLPQGRRLSNRSATRAEIDFVSAEFNGVCFESKYVDRGWGRVFQTIASSPYRVGFVATRSGLQGYDNGWALPAGLLAVLLGS